MMRQESLSPQAPAALFDPSNDPAANVRRQTLSPDRLTLIRQWRRDANGLGFAVVLAYLKFPGVVFRQIKEEDALLAVRMVWIAGNDNPATRRVIAHVRKSVRLSSKDADARVLSD